MCRRWTEGKKKLNFNAAVIEKYFNALLLELLENVSELMHLSCVLLGVARKTQLALMSLCNCLIGAA